MFVFMSIPGYFHYCSPIVEFEVRNDDASRSSFIVQDSFDYPGFFVFPYEVEYCSSVKNFAGILMGIALNLLIALVILPFLLY